MILGMLVICNGGYLFLGDCYKTSYIFDTREISSRFTASTGDDGYDTIIHIYIGDW